MAAGSFPLKILGNSGDNREESQGGEALQGERGKENLRNKLPWKVLRPLSSPCYLVT